MGCRRESNRWMNQPSVSLACRSVAVSKSGVDQRNDVRWTDERPVAASAVVFAEEWIETAFVDDMQNSAGVRAKGIGRSIRITFASLPDTFGPWVCGGPSFASSGLVAVGRVAVGPSTGVKPLPK